MKNRYFLKRMETLKGVKIWNADIFFGGVCIHNNLYIYIYQSLFAVFCLFVCVKVDVDFATFWIVQQTKVQVARVQGPSPLPTSGYATPYRTPGASPGQVTPQRNQIFSPFGQGYSPVAPSPFNLRWAKKRREKKTPGILRLAARFFFWFVSFSFLCRFFWAVNIWV